ncbi:MAG: hypothetical protein AAFO84_08305 [Cyanobacteria bacterium J06598_1]
MVKEHVTAEQAKDIEALRQATMHTWWKFCLCLWLTVGLFSLWLLRFELQELYQYFTWSAVRAMLIFNRVGGIGLVSCFALTLGLLLSESRQIIWGISNEERSRLINSLEKIQAQGPSHPQWKVIRQESASQE